MGKYSGTPPLIDFLISPEAMPSHGTSNVLVAEWISRAPEVPVSGDPINQPDDVISFGDLDVYSNFLPLRSSCYLISVSKLIEMPGVDATAGSALTALALLGQMTIMLIIFGGLMRKRKGAQARRSGCT